jgi:hypothetical protein
MKVYRHSTVPIVQKGKGRAPVAPSVPAGHELTVKFTRMPVPAIGEREIHNISVKLDVSGFYVKMSLKKKQWNKLIKGVESSGASWIAVGRGTIRKIVKKDIYLENVGFQVFERKPKT